MAQRRMLNRSLYTSSRRYASLADVAGKLADFCQALYPALMANCDDHGMQAGDAFTVKFNVFPTSPHSIPDFDKALFFLQDVGLISLYESGGKRYLYLHNFRREQPGIKYIAQPTCPKPSEEILQKDTLAGTGEDTPRSSVEEKRSRSEVEDKKKREGGAKRLTPPPDIKDLPVTEKLVKWASEKLPAWFLKNLDLEAETEKFLEKAGAKGWKYVDWELARLNWLRNAVKYAAGQGGSGNDSGSAKGVSDAKGSGSYSIRAHGATSKSPKFDKERVRGG